MKTMEITYKIMALINTGQIAHIETFRDIQSAIRQCDVYTKLKDTQDNSYYTEFFVTVATS
jgi:hypothetical protein